MYFEFYLDDLEIEEPQGFADIVLNMKRDDNWHGIFFEASTSEVAFYGAAADYLKNKKATEGLKSEVTFKAYQSCGIYEELELLFEGRLDFGKYSESCGGTCLVKLPVEQTGCLMTLRNRYDQKVDLDSSVAFNKMSALQDYTQLGQTMTLPAIELNASVSGKVATTDFNLECSYSFSNASATIFIRPNYERVSSNYIDTGQLEAINNMESSLGPEQTTCTNGPLTPQLLLQEPEGIRCFEGSFSYYSRMKATINLSEFEGNNFGRIQSIKHVIIKWDGVTGSIISSGVLVAESTIADYTGSPIGPPTSILFDDLLSGTTTLNDGEGFYAVVELIMVRSVLSTNKLTINTIWNKETEFRVSATMLCPDTEVQYYLVNEALSRTAEAITDNCLKVKSDYYGRIDSQPYSSSEDGCGSLRVLTSGLKIRKAENPAFFASLKDLFDGLRGIDNIGMGIEANPFIPDYNWLRIEPVEYFYQDVEVLRLPFVPEPEISTQEQLHYSLIKSGYQKWEVERINGLDEPNSNREYRTLLTSVNNHLDITSKFVAGSYPIETTRQQSFADTGAADTTYDNETFIICVERQAYSFIVERGNVSNTANVFSPQTLYNWRIRPFSNLMRWFKSIANSYPNINDSANRLYFSSGTGNFLAEGQLNDPLCKLENGVKAENRDLSKLDFADPGQATPLWRPDYPTFKYPLSIADYKALKANPYGYISFQCGTGEWKKGYVQSIRYRLNKGEADFILKLKYE
jgi:hypothetical protein